GIVPGGGVAFLRCLKALDKIEGDHDYMQGVKIIRRALEEPIRQIAANAGEEGTVIVEKV
ncbi:MAG: chaperonin GroEL, partial [Nitrospinaceae bacterium]|nr:chaperonin GroEL [Nitrospinaceae bacterium]NIR56862.1 chaperonin GroEL [Nitrospinaceae bacterium]NIS87328.1 chaperonin GroEL [Nitrospinaceae bacterium]NIT84182.1 chaperonin GroEL [Nitrospinaceae bacterium]NIU46368.1 chaperonin GroEL [Nitrospinaceae bacterium]